MVSNASRQSGGKYKRFCSSKGDGAGKGEGMEQGTGRGPGKGS